MTTGGKRYKAFISYSHADSRWARRVHRYLENYRVPKRLSSENGEAGPAAGRLGAVFRDRDELPSSADLGKAAEEALAASEFLVVICSPRSAASRWVNEEVLTFKRLGRADRILCIIVDGEPNATDLEGRAAQECFCPALRYRLGDGGELSSERVEPVAADGRRQGDGWPLARAKLVAGVLGVGLDDLRQRELQRRNRRLAAISTAALAGMAITLVLAITAYNARNDAERRREQADDLIAFMLGDLRERLNEVGRLDVLDSVAGKAMEYFAELPARDLDDRALARRSEALMQLGQVRLSRGDPAAAMQPFAEALAALGELAERAPADPHRAFDLGQAHFWVGYADWETGNLQGAEAAFQRYHDISDDLYGRFPENNDYLLELGYSYINLAILADQAGRSSDALEYGERMVELNREAFDRDPSNESYRRGLAEAYSWSGNLLANGLQFEASERRYREYLELSQRALLADAEDSQWLDHVMLANRFTGDAALALGGIRQAEALYRDGVEAAVQLLEIEPNNNHWQVEHAVLLRKLANTLRYAGNFPGAIDTLERLNEVTSRQREALPEDIEWMAIEADYRLVQASTLSRAGYPERAATILARNLDELASLSSRFEGSAIIQHVYGQALLEGNRPGDVITLFDSGALRPDTAKLTALLVLAQLQLGNLDAVAQQRDRLEQSGYRHPAYVEGLRRLETGP